MYTNIESDTLINRKYRDIIYTDENLQVVYMSLKKNETVEFEVHDGSQFIRIEAGSGLLTIEENEKFTEYELFDGVGVVIPPGINHEIVVFDHLKLYTIYSPPQH